MFKRRVGHDKPEHPLVAIIALMRYSTAKKIFLYLFNNLKVTVGWCWQIKNSYRKINVISVHLMIRNFGFVELQDKATYNDQDSS